MWSEYGYCQIDIDLMLIMHSKIMKRKQADYSYEQYLFDTQTYVISKSVLQGAFGKKINMGKPPNLKEYLKATEQSDNKLLTAEEKASIDAEVERIRKRQG